MRLPMSKFYDAVSDLYVNMPAPRQPTPSELKVLKSIMKRLRRHWLAIELKLEDQRHRDSTNG